MLKYIITSCLFLQTSFCLLQAQNAPYWTLVIIPDTQNYSRSEFRTENYFKPMIKWVVDNKETENIQMVMHVGDITEFNNIHDWENAKEALEQLDGELPYILTSGNHDYGPNGNASTRDTLLNDYFKVTDNPLNDPSQDGSLFLKDEGFLDNSYFPTSIEGKNYLFMALEWAPRDSVVTWANEIIRKYPTHHVILTTHAYMYSDDTRYDWHTKGTQQYWNPHSYANADTEDINDGEELWQKIGKGNYNFAMTFSGHVLNDHRAKLLSLGDNGQLVNQTLFNAQQFNEGGDGYLRLVRIFPNNMIYNYTYSTVLDKYSVNSVDQYVSSITDLQHDSDGDSLPDSFEIRYDFEFGRNIGEQHLDSDNDGLSNYQEYLAGTDPRDPDSKLSIISLQIANTTAELKWQSIPGNLYRVQTSSDLKTWDFADIITRTENTIYAESTETTAQIDLGTPTTNQQFMRILAYR